MDMRIFAIFRRHFRPKIEIRFSALQGPVFRTDKFVWTARQNFIILEIFDWTNPPKILIFPDRTFIWTVGRPSRARGGMIFVIRA